MKTKDSGCKIIYHLGKKKKKKMVLELKDVVEAFARS